MKKITISISFDDEKINALKLYLSRGELTVEDELLKAMESLYTKNVPAPVRDFIDLRAGVEPPEQPPKPKRTRSKPVAEETVEETEAETIE